MNVRAIHHVDRESIKQMFLEYEPVFILSTGRSGSKFTASLLDQADILNACHEPRPTLQYFPNYAYHHQHEEELLSQLILAARLESVLEVYIRGKIYGESNQCLTFFAPVLAKLFKKSKFVHLLRHPGDFTRSALRKGWHKNDSIWEEGRVKPKESFSWQEMDQLEKLAWLWQTTNAFIEQFTGNIAPQRVFTIKMEDLVKKRLAADNLMQFCGSPPIPAAKTRKIQKCKLNQLHIGPHEPVNIQKLAHFPEYKHWNEEDKIKLKAHTGQLAEKYGYKLT